MRCWWKKWRGAAIVGNPICEWGGRTRLGFPLTPSGGIFTGKMEWAMMRIRSALMESICGLVTFCLCSSFPFLSEVFVQHYCASRCLMFFIIKKEVKKAFKSKFSLLTKMLGKAKNALSPNLNFLRVAVFKILQFKVKNFPLTSVLPFFHCCDRRLTFGKLALIYLKSN